MKYIRHDTDYGVFAAILRRNKFISMGYFFWCQIMYVVQNVEELVRIEEIYTSANQGNRDVNIDIIDWIRNGMLIMEDLKKYEERKKR